MYRPPKWIDPFLLVPGMLWEAALRARNHLYECGRLPVRTLPRPVISIGNITLGGSGKTPLVIHLARLLEQMAATPILLSRGYGRSSKRRCNVISPEAPVLAPAQELGDEPALVRRSVPGVWLGIAADRFEAGTRIASTVPDAIFILDDGFQHRKLRRDLDLLVVDAAQPLETNRIFPRGSLREPIAALRRSHAVIINGTDDDAARLVKLVEQTHPAGEVYFCRQQIESILSYQEWTASKPVTGCGNIPVYLVAAIGNPRRFERDVAALGLEIRGSYFYRDHFTPDLKDWRTRWKDARNAGAQCMLTTEKDAVKILMDPGVPLLVAVQSTSISDSASFRAMIRRTVTAWDRDGDRG